MSTQDFAIAQNLVILLVAGALGIAVIGTLMTTFFTVEQRTTAIVQRLGKFLREAGPGLHTKVPVDEFQRSVPGTTAKDVMNLVLMTQYSTC